MHGSNVQMTCDANGWFGSFGVAVEAFVADVLTDGEPFTAEVTWGDPSVTGKVKITAIVDGEAVTENGIHIALGDVTRLEA